MENVIPAFGTAEPHRTYFVRPGAYAVLDDGEGRLAVVRTPGGIFLPGGGQAPGESLEETLAREVLEECGLAVTPGPNLGTADEFACLGRKRRYVRKRCTFFVAARAPIEPIPPIEDDHELLWLPVTEALARLTLGCERWAVERWQRL